jgi:hypothetical protein
LQLLAIVRFDMHPIRDKGIMGNDRSFTSNGKTQQPVIRDRIMRNAGIIESAKHSPFIVRERIPRKGEFPSLLLLKTPVQCCHTPLIAYKDAAGDCMGCLSADKETHGGSLDMAIPYFRTNGISEQQDAPRPSLIANDNTALFLAFHIHHAGHYQMALIFLHVFPHAGMDERHELSDHGILGDRTECDARTGKYPQHNAGWHYDITFQHDLITPYFIFY